MSRPIASPEIIDTLPVKQIMLHSVLLTVALLSVQQRKHLNILISVWKTHFILLKDKN